LLTRTNTGREVICGANSTIATTSAATSVRRSESEPAGNVLAGVVKKVHCPGQADETCVPLNGTNGIAPISMSQPIIVHVGTAIATRATTMANGSNILRM
jgi:hypothetical protein